MRITNKQIESAASMGANITSEAVPLNQIYTFAIQAVYTATPTGTLKLQASCDPYINTMPTAELPTNWTDIANSSISITAAGNYMWNVSDIGYNWVRLVYTDGSGGTSTAALTVTFNGKGF